MFFYVVKLLLEHNANIKAQDEDRSHAAYLAATKGNIEVLEILVEKDPGVIDFKGYSGTTPLMPASINGHVDVCSYFVTKQKMDVNLQDEDGEKALFWLLNKTISSL